MVFSYFFNTVKNELKETPPMSVILDENRPKYDIIDVEDGKYGTKMIGDLVLEPTPASWDSEQFVGDGNLVVGKDLNVKGKMYIRGENVRDIIERLENRIQKLEKLVQDDIFGDISKRS